MLAEPLHADAVLLGGAAPPVGRGPVTGARGQPEGVLGGALEAAASECRDRLAQQRLDRVAAACGRAAAGFGQGGEGGQAQLSEPEQSGAPYHPHLLHERRVVRLVGA